METIWTVVCALLGCGYFLHFCDGFPINLEAAGADSHQQFLTGLVAVLLTVCFVVLLAGCLCCQRRGRGFKEEKEKEKNGVDVEEGKICEEKDVVEKDDENINKDNDKHKDTENDKEFRNSPVVVSTNNLDHGHVNPIANSEFTIFTPLSPPHQNNNVFLANQQVITRIEDDFKHGDIDVHSWFDGSERDFPRTKLKYIRELGKGWFGRVVEGAAQGLKDVEDQSTWTPVAVRILDASASSNERVIFLHDAAIYRCSPHPNILRLLGRSLDTIPLLLMQEFCPIGDMKKYLHSQKSNVEAFLNSDYPLLWCCQLTDALKHLHDSKIVHPDLAARNCQISNEMNLKIGDYGMSINDYPNDYYLASPGVSVRWCAPESIEFTQTTIQAKQTTMESNIWSLGVTLWEICECGEQPYSNLSDDEVVSQVLGAPHIRLQRPTYSVLYTDYIYRLMQLCWSSLESRPRISQIDLMLVDLMQVYKNTKIQEKQPESIQNFDERWENLKPNLKAISTSSKSQIQEKHINFSQSQSNNGERNGGGKSASLNNLHGSLDNLLNPENKKSKSENQMDSWLQNVATKTGDLSFVKGLSDAMHDLDDALAQENVSSSSSNSPDLNKTKQHKLEFKLGPLKSQQQQQQQISESGSETEDENWKTKVERGAYSEKVRLKSRSVADLMILTHIDCSESDSETPLPSIDDYRVNYKNVRNPKNLELNNSLMFGSEGNLLSIKDTFEQELKKLKEERRDSLLFVPAESSSKLLIQQQQQQKGSTQEANKEEQEQEQQQQIYNVFNVSVSNSNYSPKHSKFDEIINLEEEIYYLNGVKRGVKSSLAQSDSGIDESCTESCRSIAPSDVESLPKTSLPASNDNLSEEPLSISSSIEFLEADNINNRKLLHNKLNLDEDNTRYNSSNLLSSDNVNYSDDDEFFGLSKREELFENDTTSSCDEIVETTVIKQVDSESVNEIESEEMCKDEDSEILIQNSNTKNVTRDFLIKEKQESYEEYGYDQLPIQDNDMLTEENEYDYANIEPNIPGSMGKQKCPKPDEIVEVYNQVFKPQNLDEEEDYLYEEPINKLNFKQGKEEEDIENEIYDEVKPVKTELLLTSCSKDSNLSEAIYNEVTDKINVQEEDNAIYNEISNDKKEKEIDENDIYIELEPSSSSPLNSISINSKKEQEKSNANEVIYYNEVAPNNLKLNEKEEEKVIYYNEVAANNLKLNEKEEEKVIYYNEVAANSNIDENLKFKNEEDELQIYDEVPVKEVYDYVDPINSNSLSKLIELNADSNNLNLSLSLKEEEKSTSLKSNQKIDSYSLPIDSKPLNEGEEILLINQNQVYDYVNSNDGSLPRNNQRLDEEVEDNNRLSVIYCDIADLNVQREEVVKDLDVEEEEGDYYAVPPVRELSDQDLDGYSKIPEATYDYVNPLDEKKKLIFDDSNTNSNLNKDNRLSVIYTEIAELDFNPNKTQEALLKEDYSKPLDVKESQQSVAKAKDEDNYAEVQDEGDNQQPKNWDNNLNKFKEEIRDEIKTNLSQKNDQNEENLGADSLKNKIFDVCQDFIKNECLQSPKNLIGEPQLLAEDEASSNNFQAADVPKNFQQINSEESELMKESPKNLKSTENETREKVESPKNLNDTENEVKNDETQDKEESPKNQEVQAEIKTGLIHTEPLQGDDLKNDEIKAESESELKNDETPEKEESPKNLEKQQQVQAEIRTSINHTEPLQNDDLKNYEIQLSLKVEESSLKVDESSLKIDESSLKVDELSLKVDELSLKIEEPSLKVEESSLKVDESSLKVDESSPKIEEQSLKVEESCLKVDESSLKVEESQLEEQKIDDENDEGEKAYEIVVLNGKVYEDVTELFTTEDVPTPDLAKLRYLRDDDGNIVRYMKPGSFPENPDLNPKKMVEFQLQSSSDDSKDHLNTSNQSSSSDFTPLLFTSTPFVKSKKSNVECMKKPESEFKLEEEEELLQFSSNFEPENLKDQVQSQSKNLSYSLEAWDNFLGKALEKQSSEEHYSDSEPLSLLFVEEKPVECKNPMLSTTVFSSSSTTNTEQKEDNDDLSQKMGNCKINQTNCEITPVLNLTYIPENLTITTKTVMMTDLDDDEEKSEEPTFINKNQKDGTFIKENIDGTFIKNEDGTFIKNADGTFITNADGTFIMNSDGTLDGTFIKNTEGTFMVNNLEGTFIKAESDELGGTFVKENDGDGTFIKDSGKGGGGNWEAGGGWFLHPQDQSNPDELTGQISVVQEDASSRSSGESYIGFSMDDEIMAAIRNELLIKLPHAQRSNAENVTQDLLQQQNSQEDEEGCSVERNEVFIHYNIYNTPLSPIPEESYYEEESSCQDDHAQHEDTDEESNWSEPEINEEEDAVFTETPSANVESKTTQHRHTPSQDSCCSNDTLFNLEELIPNGDQENKDNKAAENLESNENNNENEDDEEVEKYDSIDQTFTCNTESSTAKIEDESIIENCRIEIVDEAIIEEQDKEKDTLKQNSLKNQTKNKLIEKAVATAMIINNNKNVVEEENGKNNELSSLTLSSLTETEGTEETATIIADDKRKNVNIDEEGIKNKSQIECTYNVNNIIVSNQNDNTTSTNTNMVIPEIRKELIDDFLIKERENCDYLTSTVKGEEGENLTEGGEEEHSTSESYKTGSDNTFSLKINENVAPLNSPEDRQWKQLMEPFLLANQKTNQNEDDKYKSLDYNEVNNEEKLLQNQEEEDEEYVMVEYDEVPTEETYDYVTSFLADKKETADKDDKEDEVEEEQVYDVVHNTAQVNYVNTQNESNNHNLCENDNENENDKIDYANIPHSDSQLLYQNVHHRDHEQENEGGDYENFPLNQGKLEEEHENGGGGDEEEIEDADYNNPWYEYGLTDIRFSGPGDQLMSTSFSESNDLAGDQDWDSGSDTRSSSSGEFIWKEGEHEESVKALHAAPHDVNVDDVKPMENIEEEETTDTSESEGEGENTEFVPSAWDMYATPSKSALRSPEKTLEKAATATTKKDKQSKGVSFKKQKYHCVYEYPREPESPILHSYDLWKPTTEFSTLADWEIDPDCYMATACKDSNEDLRARRLKNLYPMFRISDLGSTSSSSASDFFISSTSRPFDTAPSSQFFPGRSSHWTDLIKANNDNVTPDSGIDDLTPASLVDSSDYGQLPQTNQVQPLKTLAAIAANNSLNDAKSQQQQQDILGGMRHTRNRLKLDLPSSPSSFTSNRSFCIEPPLEPIITRQTPTFTTFGKSRFHVQHVETPPDEAGETGKNVSFEAIPYKAPINFFYKPQPEEGEDEDEEDELSIVKTKSKEVVRGEASLLDSTDEDSGIESCTTTKINDSNSEKHN